MLQSMESSPGAAWLTRGDERLYMLPLSARTRQEGSKGHTSIRKAKRTGRKTQTTSLCVHTRTQTDSTQRCHSQISSLLPTQETLEEGFSFTTSACPWELGGGLLHVSRTGMDNGDAAQKTQAGTCQTILCCPRLQHLWTSLRTLGSHPLTKPKSRWRISCGLCMPKHVTSFQRKTVKAMGLNSSEEQEATFGTGPGGRANRRGQRRRTTTLFVV